MEEANITGITSLDVGDYAVDGDPRAEASDFALALTAGPSAWVTPDSASTPMVLGALALVIIGYLSMATETISAVLYRVQYRTVGQRSFLCVVVILAMLALASSAVAAIRRQQHRGGRHSMRLLRVGAVMVFSVIWVTTVPPALCLLIWPIGLSVGAEAAVTARLIGHHRDTRTLYLNYLASPLHLGAVTAAVMYGMVASNHAVRPLVLNSIGSLEVAAIGAVLAYGLVRLILERERVFTTETRRIERDAEFRRRAHWIHDDVCADLRELRVKMATHTLDHSEISQELDLFDDRLRERQLDEMLFGGYVAAAEILQSYVRRAQNAGCQIMAVPRFEQASVMLEGETARLLRRCIAGFVANALAAGATELAFELHQTHGDLHLSVTDDAGGFDLADAPAGRGLASLSSEVGPDRLRSSRSATGTTMTARIRVGDGAA